MSVSVRTRYDSTSNQIYYKWINGGAGSKIANIVADGLIQANKPMPDFEYYNLENKKEFLSDLKGKNVVINWWSTGCGPCIAEIPIVNNMVEKYKFRKSPQGIVTEVLSAVTINEHNKITDHLEIEDGIKRQLEGNN